MNARTIVGAGLMLGAGSLLLGAPKQAAAVVMFSADAKSFGFSIDKTPQSQEQSRSGVSPVNASASLQTNHAAGQETVAAFASAGAGFLRASGSALGQEFSLASAETQFTGSATAEFRIDDLFISGPGSGVAQGMVNLFVSGGVSSASNPDVNISNVAIGEGSASIGGTGGICATCSGGLLSTSAAGGKAMLTRSGFLSNFNGLGLVSIPVTFFVNHTNVFDLQLSALGDINIGIDGTPSNVQAAGSANFADTVSFPTSGPVFSLPTGFTANSPEGLIVDNRWVGSVPEPSTSFLVSFALVGLSAGRRYFFRTGSQASLGTSGPDDPKAMA